MSQKETEILRELGYEPAKTKTPQKATPNTVQGRDLFQTPRYAVDVLVPFIPKNITSVWEPACGEGRIVQRLTEHGFSVYPSDIRKAEGWVNNHVYNFFGEEGEGSEVIPYSLWEEMQVRNMAIITNPPFSLKQQFYKRCKEFSMPFALLIPADYAGWIIQATIEGAEKIIPTRRIDFVTPNVLRRIHEGEGVLYNNINEVPQELLYKYSGADFHSMWLTWGFNLGRTETFVDLPIKQKKENI